MTGQGQGGREKCRAEGCNRWPLGGSRYCAVHLVAEGQAGVVAWRQKIAANKGSLAGVFLERAPLQELKLDQANLQGAYLMGADLSGSDLRWANFGPEPGRVTDLRGALLKNARLEGANFKGAELTGADLAGSSLEGAKFMNASMEGAALAGCAAMGAKFVEANCRSVNFGSSNLGGADFYFADLMSANLADCNLAGADLRGVRLWGADLSHSRLAHSNLTGARYNELLALPDFLQGPYVKLWLMIKGKDHDLSLGAVRRVCEEINREAKGHEELYSSPPCRMLYPTRFKGISEIETASGDSALYYYMKKIGPIELRLERSELGGADRLINLVWGLTAGYGRNPWLMAFWTLVGAGIFASLIALAR